MTGYLYFRGWCRMNRDKCKVQIMDELLINHSNEIDEENFRKIKDDYSVCMKLLWIEEKFNIVSGNFYEWENEIKKSYDFFLENQSDKPNCNMIMQEYGTKEIIEFNRYLFNLLGSIRMYKDQVLHDLSPLNQELKSRFEKETNVQYDKTFAYQIMELLRNYTQHQGLIVERITAIIPFNKNIGNELWYFVEADYTSIKNIEKFNGKIKCKPSSNGEIRWINLIKLVREYYEQIIVLHNCFREITSTIYNLSTTNICQEIKKIYGDLPVKKIGFYGKETENDSQDFLLQMDYVDRLQMYRCNRPVLDFDRYYISKKSFFESDKIQVSNSVRCNFRYNR